MKVITLIRRLQRLPKADQNKQVIILNTDCEDEGICGEVITHKKTGPKAGLDASVVYLFPHVKVKHDPYQRVW